jgi:uncharacterized phage protein (TIGR02216 family)
MAVALGLLRWTPDTFWRATSRELAAAVAAFAPPPVEPPARADLVRLMQDYPDSKA